MVLIYHRVCFVKTSNSLQNHIGSGSSNRNMKAAEERIPKIVDNLKETLKEKVKKSEEIDVCV